MSLEVILVVPMSQEGREPNLQIGELPRLYSIDDVEQSPAEREPFEPPKAQLAAHIVTDIVVTRREAAPRPEDRIGIEACAPPRCLAIDLRTQVDREPFDAIVRSGRRNLQPAPDPV